jgi:hypothetical protein
MRILHRSLVLMAVMTAVGVTGALAQGSRCADCHVANAPSPIPNWSGFALRHLQDYETSPHARNNAGCDRCHGGNPNTFENFLAHKDLLPPSSPASPAHRVNLPKTCGVCHTGPFVAFQKSAHYKLLQAGDSRGPTCSTCHGEVAANLLSPTALGHQCARCHGEGEPQARPGRAEQARLLMSEVRDVRAQLREAQNLIRRIKNAELRAKLQEQWRQAEIPIIEARNAGHEFVFDNLTERLARARQRTDALMDALANPR